MPRPLREAPPSSAVARLLDVGAAARAVSATAVTAPQSTNVPPRPPAALLSQMPEAGAISLVKREFVLTPATEQSLLALIDILRRATGARLSASHVLRATLIGVEHARPTIETESRRIGPLKLPSNAHGREAERARFERRIAAALIAGMRAAASLDAES